MTIIARIFLIKNAEASVQISWGPQFAHKNHSFRPNKVSFFFPPVVLYLARGGPGARDTITRGHFFFVITLFPRWNRGARCRSKTRTYLHIICWQFTITASSSSLERVPAYLGKVAQRSRLAGERRKPNTHTELRQDTATRIRRGFFEENTAKIDSCQLKPLLKKLFAIVSHLFSISLALLLFLIHHSLTHGGQAAIFSPAAASRTSPVSPFVATRSLSASFLLFLLQKS